MKLARVDDPRGDLLDSWVWGIWDGKEYKGQVVSCDLDLDGVPFCRVIYPAGQYPA